jgi:hypothetical protein
MRRMRRILMDFGEDLFFYHRGDGVPIAIGNFEDAEILISLKLRGTIRKILIALWLCAKWMGRG